MSTIKAVDKLRGLRDEAASKMVDNPKWVCWRAEEIADEIEAEAAEMRAFCERVEKAAKAREELEVFGTVYMPLPLDADGMPIRVYDKLIAYNERFDVEGVGDGTVIFRAEDGELGELFNPAATIHAKPRTLEDVLSDFAVTLTKTSDKTNGVAKAVDECADEIRELMGVDDA